jgi:hypothetical protein
VVGLGFDPSCPRLQRGAITRFANRPIRTPCGGRTRSAGLKVRPPYRENTAHDEREPPSGVEPAGARYEGALHPMGNGTFGWSPARSAEAETRERHLAMREGIEPSSLGLTGPCSATELPHQRERAATSTARPFESRERRDAAPSPVRIVKEQDARGVRGSGGWNRTIVARFRVSLTATVHRNSRVGSGRIELPRTG